MSKRCTPYLPLILATALVSCAPDDDSETAATPGTPFLTGEVLAPTAGSITPIEEADFKDALEDQITAFRNPAYLGGLPFKLTQTDEEETNDADTCVTDQLDAQTITVQDKTIFIDASIDFASCLANTTSPVEGLAITAAKMHLLVSWTCDEDFSAYAGKTVADVEEMEDPCVTATSATMLSQADTSFTMTITGDQGTATITTRQITAHQNEAGGGCEVTRSGETLTRADNCIDVATTITTATAQGQTQTEVAYLKTKGQGLTYPVATQDPWYDSGSMDVVLGNWNGTMTYSNRTTAPTYTFTDGSSTVAGTLGEDGNDTITTFIPSQRPLSLRSYLNNLANNAKKALP